MKRAVVTGGLGFVGSHLSESLLRDGYEVVVVDNLATGSQDNLAHLDGHPRLEVRIADVRDPLDDTRPVHEIYNLACPASPKQYWTDPVGTLEASVLGAMRVLDLAHTHDARVLQASTSEVYGDPEVHPQTEDYRGNVDTMGPRSCYDEGKRCAETLFHVHRQERGIRTRVVRVFNTYGPRMQSGDGRVMPNFITQALQGEPLTVHGDGRQTRSFMYVSDLVRGMRAAMAADDNAVSKPINLGNPDERTIGELARLVIELTGSASELIHLPEAPDDPRRRQPDISAASRLLGWRPHVHLSEGLARTVGYFRTATDTAMPARALAAHGN